MSDTVIINDTIYRKDKNGEWKAYRAESPPTVQEVQEPAKQEPPKKDTSDKIFDDICEKYQKRRRP